MAKWKLCRQTYGDDIYELVDGKVTIGRGIQNKIVLSSLNISRKHCVITVKEDEVIIEDLKSANGIFVGLKKIQPNTPFSLSENDIIGLGWTEGAALAKINDTEKFVFKLLKISNVASIINRIQYQNENETHVTSSSSSSIIDRRQYQDENEPHVTSTSSIIDRIQYQIDNEPHVTSSEMLNNSINLQPAIISKPMKNLKLKRKSNSGSTTHDENNTNDAIIKKSSDNPNENSNNLFVKKFKHSFNYEDANFEPIIKIEDEHYEAFNIKQECFDDEIAIIDSDSDSEQWYIRLSQSSPRKSFSSFNETRKSEEGHRQDSSYSQLDDDVIFVSNVNLKEERLGEKEYEHDLFTTLPQPVNIFNNTTNNGIERANENCLTPESINTCNNIAEKCEQFNYMLPTLNVPIMDTVDGTSNNKTTDADYEINKNCENNIIPELTNVCNNPIQQNMEFEQVLPIKSSLTNIFNSTISNETVEKDDRINLTTNVSNDPIKKHIEGKPTIICEIETNKSHESRKIQITDHKSPRNKKSSKNSIGNLKKKIDRKSGSSSKIQITNSQKEERKKKLREIANKNKGEGEHSGNSNLLKNEECSATSKVNAKVTTSNRGAFLIDSKQLVNMPSNKRKKLKDNKNTREDVNGCKELDNINTTKSIKNNDTNDHQSEPVDKYMEQQNKTKKKNMKSKSVHNKHRTLSADTTPSALANTPDITMNRRHSDNITKENDEKNKSASINKDKSENFKSKNNTEIANSNNCQSKKKQCILLEQSGINTKTNAINDTSTSNKKETTDNIKFQNKDQVSKNNPALLTISKPSIITILKPMKENKESNRKNNKKVTFSKSPPEVLEFLIEHGNEMKKTSTARSTLAAHHSIPAFPLQKLALTKILRWNPQWLREQHNLNEPPPILGHNNVPMAVLHSFTSHMQYVDLIGDLLLMEIWECLTQGQIKNEYNRIYIPMRIESLPLVPLQRHGLELINLNVNVSVPKDDAYMIPREGEIINVLFGEERKHCRFFFVHNVRCLPSSSNNIYLVYNISLQTSFTDKMKTLQRGILMYGQRLAYINKDLKLFEAMENLFRSPLSEVVLNPQPQHFILDESDRSCSMDSQWSQSLNDSQRMAVMCAVSAARGQRARIHMIQGPPGTGKSRVICAMVMEYFYDAAGKKQRNRGKILICATSNAAVDELVIRLLDIRQSLPQPERLRLIRVGREEAMHARARDISSQRLAQRDVARLQAEPAPPNSALSAEISLLEAKKNMWQTKAMSTDDDARKAYCQSRVVEITKRIATARNGGGSGSGATAAPQQLAHAERRVLEGTDVVLTTLASAHSHKMRGLAGRIALCVVDEAGQAIEPETLVPLTLGVTRLVLVGDPQQLPGFICSQRAKDHGLGESLFSRLSSCAEAWEEGGPILLDRQYRMHPHIADYPNRAFYDGRVHNEPAHSLALHTAPYFVLGISSGDNGQDATGANNAEAWGAARVALALRSQLLAAGHPTAPSATHSLAVITPYTAQRDLIRRHLRILLQAEGCGEEAEVEVNTVDSFQGQERAVVVVSLARSHGLGFLASAGRMNVMLTRAKHALVLCLNPRALENNDQWRSLVEDAQKRNLYGMLPIQMCRPPSVQPVCNQEILQYLSSTSPVNNMRNPEHSQYRRRPQNQYRGRRQRRRNC